MSKSPESQPNPYPKGETQKIEQEELQPTPYPKSEIGIVERKFEEKSKEEKEKVIEKELEKNLDNKEKHQKMRERIFSRNVDLRVIKAGINNFYKSDDTKVKSNKGHLTNTYCTVHYGVDKYPKEERLEFYKILLDLYEEQLDLPSERQYDLSFVKSTNPDETLRERLEKEKKEKKRNKSIVSDAKFSPTEESFGMHSLIEAALRYDDLDKPQKKELIIELLSRGPELADLVVRNWKMICKEVKISEDEFKQMLNSAFPKEKK